MVARSAVLMSLVSDSVGPDDTLSYYVVSAKYICVISLELFC